MTTPDDVTRRSHASAHLSVDGLGDDLAAASLRRSAEGLLSCGIAELTVDLSALGDAYPSFVTTLARLTSTTRAHSCELFLVGLHRPAVLAALDEAPLDELFAVYQAACLHDTAPTTTVPPVPGRSAVSAWMPEQTPMTTSASAQGPVASAAPWGDSADATGAPRHARADHDINSLIMSEGTEMTSTDNTKATEWLDRDRLVELHVLAANGDTTAAAHADKWMADDPLARHMWDSVARTCNELGASSA
ncbi:hypothetical protein [Actinomycetospora straminea]|uniref:STAS domain-containing protein n=1 Tax=Actinomycetospora straminea TaxID=663607 RepID=A0ABP9F8I6_9PSEU|nr:hypothetical protein [Actinomycetospora straminea]MDD7934783.1 hypothetical protein [Actinomycetospora straminea]